VSGLQGKFATALIQKDARRIHGFTHANNRPCDFAGPVGAVPFDAMLVATEQPVNAPASGFILGTAGHIDHGKSSLVRALTGTDPDRLPEEKRRGMTIELGYAHLQLEGDAGNPIPIGIVDVPGHERFVRTMVAGATGIDLAMLVVACDDGVMPQTREHVEILNSLGITHGLIALTKSDLVDSERIDRVGRDLRGVIERTTLANWPLVPCSAKSGAGLQAIRDAVQSAASHVDRRRATAFYRMAIDRVFAVQGRGTVVTGSVLSGHAEVGMTLELHPAGARCRVREIQSHGADVRTVGAGNRAALNLTGIDRDQIERGMELATPGYLRPARYMDARVRASSHLAKGIVSHQRVRLLLGTTEEMATLVVIGAREILPGSDALVQLRLARPHVAQFGQRFIVRDETAQATLGGGRVIRPVSRRVRPMLGQELQSLQRSESDDADIRFAEWVRLAGFGEQSDLNAINDTGVEAGAIETVRRGMEAAGACVQMEQGRWVHRDAISTLEERTLAFVNRHHAAHPREVGVSRDRLIGWIEQRSAPSCGRLIQGRLEQSGRLRATGPFIAAGTFKPALSVEDAASMEAIVAEIVAAGFDPPAFASLKALAGVPKSRVRLLEDLARTESRLISVGPGVYVSRTALSRFKETVVELGQRGRFKLAQVRDALQLNRRVVQMLLEHLDREKFTRRVGDERELLEPPA